LREGAVMPDISLTGISVDCLVFLGAVHVCGSAIGPSPASPPFRHRPSVTADARTGNAVEYLICSMAKLELTSYSGTAAINSL
jgi:hypothetical protein